MSGPNPPGREPDEPESEPVSDTGDERASGNHLPPVAGGGDKLPSDQTGETDAYSRAYSAPESEHVTGGPYVPADLRLYDYDDYEESSDLDDELAAPRSACTDGGKGMIAELGGLDAARRQLADVEVIAASDVEYPLLGPWGTARVFAPQKGADMATVAVLEGRLAAWAIELDAAAGRGVSAEPGAGAAGGIGAGLLAVGGRYQSGAAIIAEHTHFADDLADAELIVTGEGRFDEQSLHGKVVGAIAAAARPLAIPVIVLAGQVSLDKSALRSAGIMAALSIAEYAGSVRLALADAANQLMGLASQVAARLGNSGPSGYR